MSREPSAGPTPSPPPNLPPMTPGPIGKQFAPCPSCGNCRATPVTFTWWGGLLGPKLLSHVRCLNCGKGYNGKHGRSNSGGIAIYTLVCVVISMVLLGGLYLVWWAP